MMSFFSLPQPLLMLMMTMVVQHTLQYRVEFSSPWLLINDIARHDTTARHDKRRMRCRQAVVVGDQPTDTGTRRQDAHILNQIPRAEVAAEEEQ